MTRTSIFDEVLVSFEVILARVRHSLDPLAKTSRAQGSPLLHANVEDLPCKSVNFGMFFFGLNYTLLQILRNFGV